MELRDNLDAQHGELVGLIAAEGDSLMRRYDNWTQACNEAGTYEGGIKMAGMAKEALDEQMDILRRLFEADRHLRAAIDVLQPDA